MKDWLSKLWTDETRFRVALRVVISVGAALAAKYGWISEDIALLVVGGAQGIAAGERNEKP